jgi:quercetin dioxygenase-like cupin family protein
MKHDRLEGMIKGWFVGDFSPVAIRSEHCEVAIKHYAAGDHEAAHYHAVATELTAIVSGRVRMLDQEWGAGDILTIEPGEATDFTALTDVVTVVVKLPSAKDDKFVV